MGHALCFEFGSGGERPGEQDRAETQDASGSSKAIQTDRQRQGEKAACSQEPHPDQEDPKA